MSDSNTSHFQQLPVTAITTQAGHNPRTFFDDSALDDLAASIQAQGVIQPIIVRPIGEEQGGIKFYVVAGERRFRAATNVGLQTYTCYYP